MKGTRKALIISISDYNDKSLSNLDFCKNDGEEMYNTLTKLGYEIPEHQKIVGRADKKTVEDAIIDFFRKNVVPDDILLFYFSGHGVLDGFGGRFFANTDTDHNIPEKDGVRFELLSQQMARSVVQKKIAILDCCFSGGAVPSTPGKAGDDLEKEAEDLGSEGLHKEFGKSQGSCILASSLSDKQSFSLRDQSFSAFTYFIIKGLKGTKDSVNENGFVTPEMLSTYVFAEMQKIPELANQKPVRNLSIAGEIILAIHEKFRQNTNEILEIGFIEKVRKLVTEGDHNENYQEALPLLEKILKINSNNVEAIISKGIILSYFGRYNEATEYFDKALYFEPENITVLTHKAICYIHEKEYLEAKKCLGILLKINPSDKQALELSKILMRRIFSDPLQRDR